MIWVHYWPLPEAGNHALALVRFIHEQHSMQHELLLRPEPTFEELAQDLEKMNSLVDRLPADTRNSARWTEHCCIVNTVSCMSCLCQ